MDYIENHNSILCGSYEAEKRTYEMIIDKYGKKWFVANQENKADNIYFCNNNPKSNGFGGRKITFKLVNGKKEEAIGPWHSNSESLFQKTGIDYRDTCLTFCVVSETRGSQKDGRSIFKNIIYKDDAPTIGVFNRGEQIAKNIANKLNKPVMCYTKSTGGSSSGLVYPDKKD